MRRQSALLFLLTCSLAAHAGGDHTPAQISRFSGSNGHYQFTVTQQGERLLYNDHCRSYRVVITPRKHTLRDTILPFPAASSHPTLRETEAAAQALKNAAAQKRTLHFGYLGSGLFPDKQQKCLYHGTGIKQYEKEIMVHQDAREGLYPYMDAE
ncbi:Uncharacterised protein [Kingella potus]|uniref:Uncharacterized protein n=1 Tax=Kingella potus TaxID=265175 RepID=A0A377R0L1_9NEIS|nr:hypothetical protein [Kingella potus]UOP01341.1 hypothetical protein LVJ84_03590 [Kingella potus]STR00348.1 Uncharacterised protein [Kingella potus]